MATLSSNGTEVDIGSLIQKIDTLSAQLAIAPKWHLDVNGTPDGLVNPAGVLIPLPGNVKGTTTNDDAPAGDVGEYVSSTVVVGSAVNLTTDTPANVTSISLTAGDWEVTGACEYVAAATTSITHLSTSSSDTSATMGGTGTENALTFPPIVPGATLEWSLPIPVNRMSIATTTTIYLVTHCIFTVDTLGAYGIIAARRVR
jgi:hypothetical protein